MSDKETKEYKYPSVYTVNSKSQPSFLYSSKQHGHFGVPKFIWSNGRISSIGSYIDINGDYGLSEYSYAIVDEPENLPKIKEVFDSKEFRNLMELCAVGKGSVNYKVISIFKKDFWKVFLESEAKSKKSPRVLVPEAPSQKPKRTSYIPLAFRGIFDKHTSTKRTMKGGRTRKRH
jgi:hypothetical protein